MTVRITDRDRRVLAKCAICRWLSTGQIQRLYFPEATSNTVQRRLRKLADEGCLRIYREHPMAEALHAVGPRARALLEQRGISAPPADENPKQIEHLRGVNEIRITFEARLSVAFFFAYWQLAGIGWSFPAIPDAICAIRAPDRQRFLIEYDRGTEPLRVLAEKLRLYDGGVPGFTPDAVLLVTEQGRELDRLRRVLQRDGVRITCLATALADVERALTEPVLLNLGDGTRCSLVRTS